jgi:hypothetical protein
MTQTMKVADVRFVKELYPRLKPLDDVVERYRDAIDDLPPITTARGGVLVDGYHRWQAHIREGRVEIEADNLGNLSDIEIKRESLIRNNKHGQQLSSADKRRAAAALWPMLELLAPGERVRDLMALLAVSERTVQEWTKDVRKAEKAAQQARAWDMWLDCRSQEQIAEAVGVAQPTISGWLSETADLREFIDPPASRQHFDVWSFQSADKDAGQQSYFGALPPQVVENLLWFWTEPGQVVVDPFVGSGTTIEVAKRMGRRVWGSDKQGDRYAPYLPIHQHDVAAGGWPDDAPRKADLVLLDPPYWQQARGRYSEDDADLANMTLPQFYDAWRWVVKAVTDHADRVAYIISPTQLDDGTVVDHATDMLEPFKAGGWRIERRVIVTYQTQQATGQQVEWARENKRLLKLYRDLVVMTK